MDFSSFLDSYFLEPLRRPGEAAPYNWANTLAYAVAALVATFAIFKGLQRLKIKIDGKFFAAILPFVLFGSALRVAQDAGTLPRAVDFFGLELFPFVTPGIYLITFGLVALSIDAALAVEKKTGIPLWKTVGGIGLILALGALLPALGLAKYWLHGLLALLMGCSGILLFKLAAAAFKHRTEWMEHAAVFGQCFDGAATFVGIGIGTPSAQYFEQHAVGGTLIEAAGPLAFYALKVVFALAAVTIVRNEFIKKEDAEKKTYVLLLLTIFGLAPGARDVLRIMAGV